MAPLPLREQRHPFLRGTHRVHVLDFEGMPVLMRDVLYARMRMEHRDGEEMESSGFARHWSKSERMIPGKGDLGDYWRDISTDGDFLGPPHSYTLIRDSVLRLCHRMMMLDRSTSLTCWHLRRFAAGRKSGALILGGVAEEALVAPGGGDKDEEMPQVVPPSPRTQGERIARLEEEVHVIMDYLVKVTKRHAFWSLNEDILKITVLTTNTPYPSRKIRRICACTHQRPRRKQDPIRRIQKKVIRRIQAI
ncbi:hypothetical protein Tco_0066414 [Tanacetum coccineum]